MTENCGTCLFKEGSCYPSGTIFDKDKTCKSYEPDYEGYIEELEKENAELRAKESFVGEQNRKLCDQQQKIEVLEKEIQDFKETNHELALESIARQKRIAELENQVREMGKQIDNLKGITNFQQSGNMSRYFELKRQSEQLTKAKELLKKFMKFYERTVRECYSKDFQKTFADTEQFLSEVEK